VRNATYYPGTSHHSTFPLLFPEASFFPSRGNGAAADASRDLLGQPLERANITFSFSGAASSLAPSYASSTVRRSATKARKECTQVHPCVEILPDAGGKEMQVTRWSHDHTGTLGAQLIAKGEPLDTDLYCMVSATTSP
jgi:hypothetical protein